MSYSTGTIKIPVLFDMSGDTIVYGEEVSGDFVSSHLDFLLDMTTEANGISLNAADISSAILIGDQDTGDNIFYSGGSSGNIAVDNLCNRIAKAITRGKLVHVPKSGDHSNSGIPMGGRANLTNNLGELGSSYAIKYLTSVAPIGDEQMLGQAMARVASIHLVGSPLAAGIFEDQNQIQTDLETASAQTFNSGNTAFYNALAVQLSKVLGGSKSSAPMNNGGGSGSGGGGGGSTADLASQISYEDFEDQAYEGTTTTLNVISGGRNADSNYCLGPPTQAGEKWIVTTTYRAVSLWHYFDSTNQTGTHPPRFFEIFTGTNGQDNIGMDVSNKKYRFFNGTASASKKAYVDGVALTFTTNRGAVLSDAITDGTWHHIYYELESTRSRATIGGLDQDAPGGDNDATVFAYADRNAKLDDVRFFNAPLSTSQIANLAIGGNGNGPIPIDIASVNSKLSGQVYSSSSHYSSDYTAPGAFNSDTTNTNTWATESGKYSGTYNGSESTSGYAGEWLQVDIGQSVVLTSYSFKTKDDVLDTYDVKKMRLFSSNDGTNWTQIQDWTNLTAADWATGKTVGPYQAPANTTGRYFRIVLNELQNTAGVYGQIAVFDLRGYEASPVSYDVASSNSRISGQTYSGSSENTYNNNDRFQYKHAFDNDASSDFNHAWLSGQNKYDTNTGVYTSAISTEGYTGEYVQVDIGESIVLKSVKIYPWDITTSTLQVHERDRTMVNKMRLFSSTNGTNWTQVKDWDNLAVADWRVGANFTSVDYTLSTSVTARYFRLVVNKVEGGDPAGNNAYGYVAIGEIELKGLTAADEARNSSSGGSSGGSPLDASGVAVPALKSIYEQLMNVPGRSQIMETRDISGVVGNANTTLTGGFPFISGDKLVMYLRPKIVFAAQTKAEQNTTLITASGPTTTTIDVPVYDIGRKSSAGGTISGQVYTNSSSHADNDTWGFHKAFEGTHTDDEDWTTAGDGNHIYENGTYRYIGDQVTKNIGETKNITVTTAKIQNNNQLVDTEDIFIYGMGFIHYLNLQVGDTVTYEHPTLGSQTTTISAVYTGGVTDVPYMIILTDPHNVNLGVTVSSCTFHNKKEGLAGEWGQVDIGQNTVINKFQIWPRPSYRSSRSPADFSLLGSLDGTNWNFIKSVSGLVASDWATNNGNTPAGTKTWELGSVHGPYRYYRLQVQKTVAYGDGRLALTGLLLYGAKSPSEVTTGSTGSVSDISGIQTNIIATPENIEDAFPGNANAGNKPEINKWGWMGSANSDTLSLETTDVTDSRTCDLHIWKITITL